MDSSITPQNTAPRCLLIVPDSGVNPRMGGGQRSIICFEALKQIGPVDVAVLGVGPDKDQGVAIFFPGAASVQRIPSSRFSTTPKTGLDWLINNLRRFLFVPQLYAPEHQVMQALSETFEKDHHVVVCRYALPFCVSGLTSSDQRHVFVDIDDRDDQKFQTAAHAVLGQGILGWVFRNRVVPAIRRQLQLRLPEARLLWYATQEDDLNITGPKTAVLRNVPFQVAVPTSLPLPSTCKDVLFVGSYAHRPNQDGAEWFLKHCWAELACRNPDARLRLVGLGPWQDMALNFPDLERVDYIGTVDDIASEYLQARLVISPIFDGGGSKIKVIEACAYSRPVVATSHSARGFGDALEKTIPQNDNPAAFLDTCDQLLKDGSAADVLGGRLRELQAAHFSQSATEAQIVADISAVLYAAPESDG